MGSVTGSDLSSFESWDKPESDRQYKAAFVVANMLLGIVADSLLYTAINTQEEMRTGHFKIDASKPSIASLGLMRMQTSGPGGSDPAVQSTYEGFVSLLPQSMQDQLNKPPLERDPVYSALGNVLQFASSLTVWLGGSPSVENATGASGDRLSMNLMGPFVALVGTMAVGEDVAATVGQVLSEIGANDPNYGNWQEKLSQFGEILNTVQDVLGRIVNGQAAPGDLEQLQNVAGQIDLLLSGPSPEGGAGLIQAHLASLGMLLECFRSPLDVSPSFMMALLMGTMGVNSGGEGDPLAGGVGDAIQTLSSGIVPEGADQGAGSLLQSAVSVVALGIAVGVAAVMSGALGMTPEKGETEVKSMRLLEASLLMTLVVNSGIMESVMGQLATAAGIPEGEQPLYGQQMTLAMLTFAAAVGGGGDVDKEEKLLRGVEKEFGKALHEVAKEWMERATDGGSPELIAGAVSLENAASLMREGDVPAALGAIGSALSHGGVSQDSFSAGIASLGILSASLLMAFSLGVQESGGQATEMALMG